MLNRILPGLMAVLMVAPAFADIGGKGELGLVVARGNSETETANARIELIWTHERWTNESTANLVYARDSGETNSSRFVLGNKTDYSLSERSYILAALRYDRDRFSSYVYQGSASVGYGYKLIDRERHKLSGEIGPGVRFFEERDVGEAESEFIGRGFLNYRWIISDNAELANRFLVESSEDNTFLENSLGLTVAINSRVSMKAGVAVRHNTDVGPNRKKTDTLTTINLVYNWGSH